jgi:hypothetical protein
MIHAPAILYLEIISQGTVLKGGIGAHLFVPFGIVVQVVYTKQKGI